MLKQLEAVYCLLSWLGASTVLAVPWQVALALVGVENAGLQLPSAAPVSPVHVPTWLHNHTPFNALMAVKLLPVLCVLTV